VQKQRHSSLRVSDREDEKAKSRSEVVHCSHTAPAIVEAGYKRKQVTVNYYGYERIVGNLNGLVKLFSPQERFFLKEHSKWPKTFFCVP
jgi:hypothetical protein